MADITFTSPLLEKDLTVYATAGDRRTLLAVAKKNKVPLPFECEDGECGSCLIEVVHLENKSMGQALTDKERHVLVAAGKLTKAEIADAEEKDLSPKYRLACQYIVRDEPILVKFSGEPGVTL